MRENVETVSDFTVLGSKITADGDCSYEIKRQLLLGRKVMTNLHSNIKKQRHYFSNKDLYSQSYGFSSSHMHVRVGPESRLSAEELMLSNCSAREDS